MRVLVVTNMYPPHHYGGYELSCRDVVQRWRDAGHHVDVLTSDLEVPGVETPSDDDARRQLRIYWRDGLIFDPGPLGSFRSERHNTAVLDEALDELRPDVVSAWHVGTLSLSLLSRVKERGVPLVLVVCDDWMIYGPVVDGWTKRTRARRRLAKIGDGTTACFVSAYTRDRALERSPIRPSTFAVTPTGIDTNDFPVASPEVRPWTNRLLCVGRIEERKGVHIAIEALAGLSGTTLTISGLGEASYLEQLNDLARRLGVAERVTFTFAPRGELRNLYSAAGVFCFPVTWNEPFGLTPIEAMACATPVVGTVRAGSTEFFVDGTNCFAVPSGDPAALASAVRTLEADASLRERLVRGGIETASRFTVDRYASALEQWHLWAAGERDERPAY